MNILNNQKTNFGSRSLFTIGILSLFCYLIVVVGVVGVQAQTIKLPFDEPGGVGVGTVGSYYDNNPNVGRGSTDGTVIDPNSFDGANWETNQSYNFSPQQGSPSVSGGTNSRGGTTGGTRYPTEYNSNGDVIPRAILINEQTGLPYESNPSYNFSQYGSQNNNGAVITPNSQSIPQAGPKISDLCGFSPAKGLWDYCMLAPMKGLIGKEIGTGADSIEKFPIEGDSLQIFFAKVYRIGIIIAIALAIVMISFGGIRLATTDSIGGTENGKKMVNAALAGLFIALFSYVLLYTINPALVSNGAGTIFKTTTTTQTP